MDFTLPWNKIKTINWSDFFQIEHDPLVFLQIIPNISIQNGVKINNILHGLHAIKNDVLDRIKFKDAKLIYRKKDIISYAILYQKDKITFHLAVPSSFENFITQRIYSVWRHSTVLSSKEDYLDLFDKEKTLEINLQQKHHYFKSFLGDYRHNAPIPSLLAVSKDIQDNDKAMLEIVLNPINDYWKNEATEMYKKYKKGLLKNEDKPTGSIGMIFFELTKLIDKLFEGLDMLMGVKVAENVEDKIKQLLAVKTTETTRQKVKYDGFQGNIRILSQSDDYIRREQTSNSITISLRDIEDQQDNELQIKSKKLNPKTLKRKVSYFSKDIYSSKELGVLMQMPEANLQSEYPVVENISTAEVNLPQELFNEGIPLGEVKYKGVKKIASWNIKNKNIAVLPKVFVGGQNSGKTTYAANFSVEALLKGQSVFVFDVNDGKLCDNIRDYLPSDFPEEKIIDLDFANGLYSFPLSWNEFGNIANKSGLEVSRLANQLTQQVIYFLNTISEEPLTPRMIRFLASASKLVFSSGSTSIVDIINVLNDHRFRANLLESTKVNSKVKSDLEELNEYDKQGYLVGTKYNLIQGIIDRMDLMLSDDNLSLFLGTKDNGSLNFRKWADDGCCVLIRVPKSVFFDNTTNTLVTFLVSKLWLAILSRYDDIKNQENWTPVHCCLDEPHSFNMITKLLYGAIRESRKWRLGFLFMVHEFGDFKSLLPVLKSAGVSYCLFQTSEDNLKALKNEIVPFSVEEALNTPPFSAICRINYNNSYSTFLSKIIPPVEIRYTKTDREYLVNKYSSELGQLITEENDE